MLVTSQDGALMCRAALFVAHWILSTVPGNFMHCSRDYLDSAVSP